LWDFGENLQNNGRKKKHPTDAGIKVSGREQIHIGFDALSTHIIRPQ
jgi:hypothetical protein